jgi:hypothetical protein
MLTLNQNKKIIFMKIRESLFLIYQIFTLHKDYFRNKYKAIVITICKEENQNLKEILQTLEFK